MLLQLLYFILFAVSNAQPDDDPAMGRPQLPPLPPIYMRYRHECDGKDTSTCCQRTILPAVLVRIVPHVTQMLRMNAAPATLIPYGSDTIDGSLSRGLDALRAAIDRYVAHDISKILQSGVDGLSFTCKYNIDDDEYLLGFIAWLNFNFRFTTDATAYFLCLRGEEAVVRNESFIGYCSSGSSSDTDDDLFSIADATGEGFGTAEAGGSSLANVARRVTFVEPMFVRCFDVRAPANHYQDTKRPGSKG